ncbi:DUF2877 domain-containing protein [Streptomyces sp. VRA16 Mangrove soil]|uniref:DUF2877 domain-containing protein n=1 Tax=Streptomyces sp. VRA16 Mangrove soil TaxID=2817434 RepID=UPI001A9E1C36|nr:DUF2877 domain-containing protein [Streptomyces sp. VRA16 Mangrove soil]MBO1331570.1 DUF2877 domain-containing protein [Streptomyces sp. VRA16 Mangrove soil]
MTTLEGLVSSSVARLLDGPERAARVVAATRYAVHLATGDPELPALAVVTRDAIRLPNAVVVPHTCAELSFAAVRPGTDAVLGAGTVRVGPRTVRTAGQWTPPRVLPGRPRLDGPALDRLIDQWAPPPPRPVAVALGRLRAALRAGDDAATGDAAHALLGLGPGLTPSGDDILCGLLLARRAWGGPLAPLRAAVAHAPRRTTLLSAALVRHAARGECVAPAHALLTGTTDPRTALRALLTVGHHSGGDLARGVAAALG